jgi:hypothetical protein
LAVSTNSFSQFVSNSVAAIQGAAVQLTDLTVGSVLRAFVDAYSLLALWLQAIALQVASLTRFATSNGPDADSWGADFGYAREEGTAASGPVTFARYTATLQATIPVGSIVQTATGTQYQAIADTTQTAFNAALNAYVIPAATTSITATVQALDTGSAGNAGAGLINTLGASIAGVDTVTNAAPFTNGTDPQTDPEYKAGFPGFMQSLSRATPAAIKYAIQSLGQNVDFTFTENYTLAGVAQPGFFYVVADNGTGNPPSGFLSSVANAIEAVRGESISYAVYGPTIVNANVAMVLTTGSGYVHATVVANVSAALSAYIDSLPIGATLPYTILASIAYGVAGVTNVTGVTLNSGTSDLVPTSAQIVKSATLSIS